MNHEEILDSLESDLMKFEDVELILLKGHLILEQALNQHLALYISDRNKLKSLRLMFSKKIDLLVALDGSFFSNKDRILQLKEINRIRNKLAHEIKFDHYHDDLKSWACEVLGYTPKTINRNSTYKNTLVKAFIFCTAVLVGASEAMHSIQNAKR